MGYIVCVGFHMQEKSIKEPISFLLPLRDGFKETSNEEVMITKVMILLKFYLESSRTLDMVPWNFHQKLQTGICRQGG